MHKWPSAYRHFIGMLSKRYDEREAASITKLVFEKVAGRKMTMLLSEPESSILAEQSVQLQSHLEKLMAGSPVQYVLGEAWFHNRLFKVNEHVLIPRPETEELVQWVLSDAGDKRPSILDVGSGSGCIAVSLASELPEANVTALDVSTEALHMVAENATCAGVEVTAIKTDFLTWEPGGRRFDIVVSNPPYIPASERILLDAHVVEHEPHLALFVPDPDPLLFYRKLAELGPSILAPGGRMYMETHHAFASEVEQLFRDAGYQQVDVRKDIHEKPRMVRAEM